MEFRLLGPLEVRAHGQVLEIRGRRPRALLATLLLQPNRPVPVGRLIDALWGTEPPAAAKQSVQFFVHQLRRALADNRDGHKERNARTGVLETHGSGYLLRVAPGELDTERFRELVERARGARADGDLQRAWDDFTAALGLWRGPALADFADETFAQPEIARLEELRLAAVEEQMKAGLALGRHAEIIGELEGLVRAEPLREQLRALLMIALYRAGRQAEALTVYREARETFVERLGIEPGSELQWLERAILEQHPSLDPPEPAWRPPAPAEREQQPRPSRGAGAAPESPPEDPPQPAAAPVAGPQPAAPTAPAPEQAPAPVPPAPPATRERHREERKTVTVLVASISGDGGELDPEDVRARLEDALSRVRERVEHYGGHVQAFVMGRLLAVFGAPRSHEDDPERAVRAALEICAETRAPGSTQQARVGVATGEVVVSLTERVTAGAEGGNGDAPAEPVSMTVAGDVVHAAAALESMAPPGVVVAGTGTYRATRRVIDYRPLRRQAALLEQATGSVAWQAIAPRGRTGAEVGERKVSPLVERERELSLLSDLLDRFLREAEPQFLTVVSEPGLGKTRLVAELGLLADRAPQLVTWRRGRSMAYGEGAFSSLVQVVNAHAGVLESDPAPAAEAKLAAAVAEVTSDPGEAEEVTRHLRLLLGAGTLAELPQGRPDAAYPGWARFLGAVADERPLVVVFEDLQWADDALLDFVEDLPERVGSVPLLVVATGRLELLDRRPGWGGGKRNAVTLSLTPLSREGTGALLDALLDGTPLPPETRDAMLSSSGGNPLYVEEYVRMLHDLPAPSPDGGLPIPESVQQLIAARLDALPLEDKLLLQDAAVIGEVGWAGALMAVGNRDREQVLAGLRRLERRELLRRVRVASVAAETEYTFRHALVRDVAYTQVLRSDRAEKHRRVAAWIESLNPDRADERIELLAHHYNQALALARTSGPPDPEMAERDRTALRRAGNRAVALGAYMTAARFYRQALALDPEDNADPRLLLSLGQALVFSQHTGQDELLRARDRFDAAGDHNHAAEAEVLLGQLARIHSDNDGAHKYMQQALARPTSTPAVKLGALGALACDLMASERHQAAITKGEEALRVAEEHGLQDAEGAALARVAIGMARVHLGDPAGMDELQRAARLIEERNYPSAGFARLALATGWCIAGDLGRASLAIQEGRRQMAAAHTIVVHWLDAVQAVLDHASGRWGAVLRYVDDAQRRWRKGELDMVRPWFLAARAGVWLGRGELDAALADVTEVADISEATQNRRYRQIALGIRGRALLAAGDRDQAAACLDRALAALRDNTEEEVFTSDLALLMVDLDRPATELPEQLPPTRWHLAATALARRDFQTAAAAYARIGDATDAAQAHLRAAAELAAAGHATRARALLTDATAFLEGAQAHAWLRDAEALRAKLPGPDGRAGDPTQKLSAS